MTSSFYVVGRPAPQGSWRRGRAGQVIAASKHLDAWRAAVAAAAHESRRQPASARGVVFLGPVVVDLAFDLARPKAHYSAGGGLKMAWLGAYPRRPDVDKLARSTLDGLVLGALIGDDSQVVGLSATKRYADSPGCAIRVESVAP